MELKKMADKISTEAKRLGFNVDDSSWGGVCGNSIYINITKRIGKKFVSGSYRISSHSVGTRRMFDHFHVSKEADVDLAIAHLSETNIKFNDFCKTEGE